MPARRVVLLRHADAESSQGQPDRERRLTRHGEAQAARIGRALRGHGFLPDAIVASPAPRAAQTARLAAAAAEAKAPVTFEEALYGADEAGILAVVGRHASGTVWVVGHNPGLSDAAAQLGFADGLGKACAAVFEVQGWTARLLAHLSPE